MRKVNVTLFGFITVLIVGLAVVLSQRTLLAEQDTTTEASAAKTQLKTSEKIKHKDKKQLKKGFKKGKPKEGKLKEGKKIGAKETVKTNTKEKGEIGQGADVAKTK